MHEDPHEKIRDRLERYLDGAMDALEREAFERELGAERGLRRHVEVQREIDRVLIERFGPAGGSLSAGDPGRHDLGTRANPVLVQHAAPAGGGHRLQRPALIAAAALLVLGVGAYVAMVPARAPFDQPGEVYARIVASGFEPREVCTDDAAFRDWMRRRFDQDMVIPADSAGVELVGWDYKRVLTTRTGVLLARVDGREVVVLVERRENARRLGRTSEGLRVFRRDVGGVTLYEVTPLSEARLLPLAKAPG